MLMTHCSIESSAPRGTWKSARENNLSQRSTTPTVACTRRKRRVCLESSFCNGIFRETMRVSKKLPFAALKITFLCLIFSNVFTISTSSISAGGQTSSEVGYELSLLEYDPILLSEESESQENSVAHDLNSLLASGTKLVQENPTGGEINLDRFNLLWLVASKLESIDKLQNLDAGINANTSSSNHIQSDNDTITNTGNEIYLNSAWPRSYLRYGKADVPISRVRVAAPDKSAVSPPALLQTLSDFLDLPTANTRPNLGHEIVTHRNLYEDKVDTLNRFINGKSIGFEMEFRVEEKSGSGYIITGRSVVGQPYFTTVDSTQNTDQALSEHQSWFGLYCVSRNSEYILRLEYRNAASKDRTPQQFVLVDSVRKGEWQKLAVTIDFDDNTINYWVNCSAKRLKQLRENIDHPSSLYSIYRLLQHRRHSTTPVEVTFRSAVVTDGRHSLAPKQCEQEQVAVCSGGRIYMTCGPSCERTCEGIQSPQMTDKYLRTCAVACVKGCHCRPGYVTYNETCVKPEQCPCFIGDVSYQPGQNVTINNELCTCSKGEWQCYSSPRMTQMPRNQSIILGQSTQLVCAVSGNPEPIITWEVPTGSNHRIVSKDFGRVSHVELRAATRSESGIYKCRAHLPTNGWEYVAIAKLDVNSPPKISLPSAIPITSGHHVLSIDCAVTGIPAPEIYWIRHDAPVIPSDRIVVNKSPGLSRLKIHNVRRSDAGEWSCRARNKAGYAIKAVRILVRLPEPNNMAFSRKPVNQYVKRGHAAIFMCKMVSYPSAYNMTWLKDGVRLNFTTKRVVMKSYRLVIRKVRDEDAGTYTCVVRLKRGGSELRAKADLMIKGRMLSWSEWSKCSASCGKGLMFKRRTCTGVPPNKKTCHGDFAKLKPCNTQICPGTCSVYGDPHYTTFDGREFNFHGECGYTLSEDVVGNDFKVYLYNEDCGMGLNCLARVTVMLSKRGLGAVVEIEKTGLVTVNGVRTSLPHVSKDSSLVVDKIGLYIIVNAGPDFELKWAVPHRFYLIIGPRYFDRTQGFCGNFNGDPNDDNILRSGRQASSDLEFALNWAVRDGSSNHSCSAFLQPLADPCSANLTLYESAHEICGFLNNRETFAHCHRKVPPDRFIETCEFDICRTSETNINTYLFCTAMSAYAEECLRHAVVLNWRKDDFCHESCVGGKVYEECGPRCARYCPGIINESGTVCSSNEACVSGCHCQRHMVLHEGRCIRPQRCPCVHRGVQYKSNTTVNRNCEKCMCRSGRWKCVFNKALCEFPSSIIKGPVPQVVPNGRSVSFCCEVAGVPKPIVEWYRDGRAVPPQTDEATQTNEHADGTLKNGYVKSYYQIANLTKRDEGSYYCKAINKLGSQISETVSLTVVEPWMATCNPVPSKRIITLPEGCRRGGARELNVGHCPSLPCFYERPNVNNPRLRRKDRCGGTKQCCRPLHLQPVLVRCTEAGRHFPLYITTITKCSCSICESTYTIVEGALLTAMTGKLMNDVKIDYRGRVVGYTSKTGSFNLKLRSLPEDPRHISLTFTDILHKRFPITVKNLPIIVGETTTHKVLINGHGFKIRFDANIGLRHQFRSSMSRNKDRLRIIIPPQAVILQQAIRPYIGRVDAIISIVEKNYELDRRKLDAMPGDFVAVDRRGHKQILKPSYVVSVSLFSQYGKPLDLLPERAATFLVTSVALGNRMQPWVLDELTGLWREGETKVQMHPNFNKRGEKILILAAKIPRINTAWALSDSEDACYVRVRALDKDNNTVAGVRFVMTTTSELPRHSTRSRRIPRHATQLSTVVESLTRSSDTNGICMPIGCENFGFITAAKLANELAPLLPDKPLPELGTITSTVSPAYGVPNPVIQTLSAHESNNIDRRDTETRQPTLYFANEDQCRTTVADKRTYVFRDNSQKEVSGYKEASRKAALAAATRVTPTRINRRPLLSRKRYYCHLKVVVILPELYRPVGNLMTILAATYNGRNSSGSSIGWRRTSFRAPVRRPQSKAGYRGTTRPRIRRVLKEYCVEYLCGEDKQADMAYVTIKQLKEGFTKGSVPLQCRFVRSANMTASRAVSNQRNTSPTKGGYVIMPPVSINDEAGSSHSRQATRVYPQLAFQDRSVLDSKKQCLRTHGSTFTSAWIRCT